MAKKIGEKPEEEREAYVEQLRKEYREDIDIHRLASELHVDAIVPGDGLRAELVRRLDYMESKADQRPPKKHCVYPV